MRSVEEMSAVVDTDLSRSNLLCMDLRQRCGGTKAVQLLPCRAQTVDAVLCGSSFPIIGMCYLLQHEQFTLVGSHVCVGGLSHPLA